jgi:hypothetical protein
MYGVVISLSFVVFHLMKCEHVCRCGRMPGKHQERHNALPQLQVQTGQCLQVRIQLAIVKLACFTLHKRASVNQRVCSSVFVERALHLKEEYLFNEALFTEGVPVAYAKAVRSRYALPKQSEHCLRCAS